MDNVEKIMSSNGKIFNVVFTKQDGTIRSMNARLGVTKHLKGGVSTLNTNEYITVFDMQKKAYRAINKKTIISVRGL